MAMELSNGGGLTGALLDSLTPPLPLEDGTLLTVSQLLASYILHGDTYGARQSRALLPDLDPANHLETRFPTLTIVFFMKEFVVPLLAATQDSAKMARRSCPFLWRFLSARIPAGRSASFSTIWHPALQKRSRI